MSPDLSVKTSACQIHDMIEAVHFQVDDPSALGTDKMVMRGSIRIKMINTVIETQTLYLADIRK